MKSTEKVSAFGIELINERTGELSSLHLERPLTAAQSTRLRLLIADGTFFQWLETASSALETALERIQR